MKISSKYWNLTTSKFLNMNYGVGMDIKANGLKTEVTNYFLHGLMLSFVMNYLI